MLKTLAVSLYTRVVVAYRSTLLGLGLVAADVLISTLDAQPLPQWAHMVVGIAASILALYKPKVPALPEPKPVP